MPASRNGLDTREAEQLSELPDSVDGVVGFP
jgi:hypothetical protein